MLRSFKSGIAIAAAAAMAVAGLAGGTAVANAASTASAIVPGLGDFTITVPNKAQLKGGKFQFIQLAQYVNAQNAPNAQGTQQSVTTGPYALRTVESIEPLVVTALGQMSSAGSNNKPYKASDGDPMQWAAVTQTLGNQNDGGVVSSNERTFANNLWTATWGSNAQATTPAAPSPANTYGTFSTPAEGANSQIQVQNVANGQQVNASTGSAALNSEGTVLTVKLPAGIYLVKDVNENNPSVPMLIGTSFQGWDGQTQSVKTFSQTVQLKNTSISTFSKTWQNADLNSNSPLVVGSKLDYTITTSFPDINNLNQAWWIVQDTPSLGLTVNPSTVQINGQALPSSTQITPSAAFNGNWNPAKNHDVPFYATGLTSTQGANLDPSGAVQSGAATYFNHFQLAFNLDTLKALAQQLSLKAGNEVKFTYQATINSEAGSSPIQNAVVVDFSRNGEKFPPVHTKTSNPSSTQQQHHPHQTGVVLGTFQFKSLYKSTDKPAPGAQFIVEDSQGQYLTAGANQNGGFAASPRTTGFAATAPTSASWGQNEQGALKFTANDKGIVEMNVPIGLGKYTIKEVQQANNSMKFLPSFSVSIENKDAQNSNLATISGVTPVSDFWGLISPTAVPTAGYFATGTGEGKPYIATIYAVTSIAQLPRTGGAGILMGTLLALILLGVAGGLFIEYRKRHARTAA